MKFEWKCVVHDDVFVMLQAKWRPFWWHICTVGDCDVIMWWWVALPPLLQPPWQPRWNLVPITSSPICGSESAGYWKNAAPQPRFLWTWGQRNISNPTDMLCNNYAIITFEWRRNVVLSFWRNDNVVITSYVRWVINHWKYWTYKMLFGYILSCVCLRLCPPSKSP